MIWAIRDALAIGKRNVLGLMRVPTTVVFSTIQPVIFVILFRYVFGGAIEKVLPPGVPYVNFLMAGIFVQTVTFGSSNTGIGLAEDLRKGLIERFRSLPMARSAVLAGRTLADTLRNLFVVVLMMVVGFLVGFRPHTTVPAFLLAILLILMFGFAMSWVMALVGLSSGNAEAAQAASFPLLAVLVFASNAFVPASSMPGWLEAFVNHQPVAAMVTAVRHLFIGTPGEVLPAFLWCIGIVAVFAPLSVRKYRRAA